MQATAQGPGGRWLYTVAGWQSDEVLALTTDPSGATIALVADSSYVTPPNLPNIILRKLDSNGYLIWERAFQGAPESIERGSGLGTDASGNIYMLWAGFCWDYGCAHTGPIDFGGGPTGGGTLVKLSPTGDFIWQRAAPLGGAQYLAVNASGESVFTTYNGYGAASIVKTRADGTTAWSVHGGGQVGIDPSGNVLVGCCEGGPGVSKLAASDGSVLWARVFAPGAAGGAIGFGSSALGTVVAVEYLDGAFTFAGQSFDTRGNISAAFLFVLEPNGEPRFVRRLPDAIWPTAYMAVDPSGKVSMVGRGRYEAPVASPGFTVTWYNLAGDYIGQLEFPASNASGDITPSAIAIASDGSTVVGGTYSGVATGSPDGSHAFVMGGLFRVNSPSFVDEFNRTSLGPTWDVTHGTFIDDGSAARGTSFGSYAFWTGVPGPNDTAEVTILPSRNLGAIVRGDPNDPDRNHYTGYVDSSGYIRIARRRDWVYSYLAIGRQFPSGSHRLSITATGSAPVRLAVRLDDTTVLTYNDYSSAAITGGGRVGMFDYNGLSQPIDRFRVIRR